MEWVHVGNQKWCFKRSDWAMWLGRNWCGWKLRLSEMLRLLKVLWAGVKPAMLQRMACSGMYLQEEGVPLHPHTPMCVVYNYIVCLIVLHSQKKLPNMFSRMKASIDRYKLSLHTRYLEHRTLRYDYLCVWLTNILYVSYAEWPPNESRTRSAEWKLALTATNRVFIQYIWSIEHWDMIISVFGYKYIICASNDHTQHVWCLPKATLAH